MLLQFSLLNCHQVIGRIGEKSNILSHPFYWFIANYQHIFYQFANLPETNLSEGNSFSKYFMFHCYHEIYIIYFKVFLDIKGSLTLKQVLEG